MADPNVVPIEPQPTNGVLHTEPILSLNFLYAVVAVILEGLAAWGIDVSDAKRTAIETAIPLIFTVIATIHTRSIAWSPASVTTAEKVAKSAGAAGK